MPGLWDCHGHFLGLPTLDLTRWATDPLPLRAARCAHDLRAALDAGVTSVREPGGLGVHLARVVNEGLLEGPAIYGAGAILGTTGGHADVHGLPQAWMTHFGQSGGDLRQCDGVDDCVRAVREQLRKNAKLIKVCASGGVFSEVDDPIHQQFTVAELRAMVEVAAMADRLVAAHCHGKPGIMAALEAGVGTIEHGTYLDEEACDAMREAGVILVPTRTILHETLDSGDLPPYAKAKMAAIADRHAAAVALAHERGVTIAMGTDIAFTGPEMPDSWGRNGRELPLLVEAGLTPLQAIEAATANGPGHSVRRRPAAACSPRAMTPTSSPWTPTHWPTSRSWPTQTTWSACGAAADKSSPHPCRDGSWPAGPCTWDLILIRHIRGMRSSWSGEDDQLNGRMEVTVVVRSIPGLSV
jgi:imidazolonepropionase-like amidohydrolase